MKLKPPADPEVPEEEPNKSKGKKVKTSNPGVLSLMVLMSAKILMIGFVIIALLVIGLGLFRGPLLERYFTKQTGYPIEVGKFDIFVRQPTIELHNVVIGNIDPYPETPLVEIRRLRLEWYPQRTQEFPRQLKLLEIEIDRLTLIRRDGNAFNILDFVEALVVAWGAETDESGNEIAEKSPFVIEETWILWDHLIAIDDEVKGGKRMEVFMEYEGAHDNVRRIRELTDPAIQRAKDEVDRFYFFNYLGDSIRSLIQ